MAGVEREWPTPTPPASWQRGKPQTAPDWAAVDFGRPWLEPYRRWGEPLLARVRRGEPVHAAAQALGPAPALAPRAEAPAGPPPAALRFVPQSALPTGVPYETHIRQSGQIPTRDNLHDFFNALVWWTFPQIKSQLNALHHEEISANGIRARRGPVRDAATVWDENGALLQAPEPLWQALLARDWPRLFVRLRPLWAQARLTLVGHALLEQLVEPRKNLTAHVLIAPCAIEFGGDVAALDAAVAPRLSAAWLRTKPLTPLPVLGVPGWWEANEAPAFYADTAVFRPPRPPLQPAPAAPEAATAPGGMAKLDGAGASAGPAELAWRR